MSPRAREMDNMSDAEIRAEIKHLVKAVESNSETTNAIALNVSKLTEFMIRNEEAKSRQNEINHDLTTRVKANEDDIRDIVLSRAKEEQSRNFVMKYWPWLLVAVVLGTAVVTYVLQRQVV